MTLSPHFHTKVVEAEQAYARYTGTTAANGEFSVVYATPYSTIPAVVPVIVPNTTPARTIRVTSSTTTGFTVKVEQRNNAELLGLQVLLATVSNVSGATVSVTVLP